MTIDDVMRMRGAAAATRTSRTTQLIIQSGQASDIRKYDFDLRPQTCWGELNSLDQKNFPPTERKKKKSSKDPS
jgi:hypothetical protein